MKKILIALGAVAMVFATQAASVDWEIIPFDSIPSVDGTGTWSGSATLTFVETGYSTTVDVTDGDFYYAGTVDTDLAADYTFTLTATDPTSGATYSATGSGSSDNFGTGFGGIDAGTWSAVPEPTSGLLMLLGVAGLALKRKRA